MQWKYVCQHHKKSYHNNPITFCGTPNNYHLYCDFWPYDLIWSLNFIWRLKSNGKKTLAKWPFLPMCSFATNQHLLWSDTFQLTSRERNWLPNFKSEFAKRESSQGVENTKSNPLGSLASLLRPTASACRKRVACGRANLSQFGHWVAKLAENFRVATT